MAYEPTRLSRLLPGMIFDVADPALFYLDTVCRNVVGWDSMVSVNGAPLMAQAQLSAQAQANYYEGTMAAQHKAATPFAKGKTVIQNNAIDKLGVPKPGTFHTASTEPLEPEKKQRIESTETPLAHRDLGSF